MKIFIGSSHESAKTMKLIEKWLPPHTAVPWDTAFREEEGFLDELIRHSQTLDGAILLFAEDDLTLIRGDVLPTTRDNVWLEYGLFVGALGRDRVRRINLGKPKCATDLLGITCINLPGDKDAKRAVKKAKQAVQGWVRELAPAFFRNFAFEVVRKLAGRAQLDVETILRNRAPAFMNEKSVKQIRALCSNKGRYAKKYYGGQFKWVKKQLNRRTLHRVFVAQRDSRHRPVFSPGEAKGILMHLKHECDEIEARWVFADEIGASYGDSLGFALFEKKWIVHWGLKSGFCYRGPADKEIGEYLVNHFENLWEHALPFDPGMRAKLFRTSRRPQLREKRNKRRVRRTMR